jgi:FkbM family methyltransferase
MTLPNTGEGVVSPNGNRVVFAYRDETTDLSTIAATNTLWGFSSNEYGLRGRRPMTGWAIDVGAHVGSVAIALAVDHPNLRVLAVEALAENCELIRETVALNGLTNVEVIEAAASDVVRPKVAVAYGWTSADNMDDSYVQTSRFVGGMLTDPSGKVAYPPGVSLTSLLKQYEIDRVSFLKIDCEGCEWAFLTSKDIGRVDEIIGEYHFGGGMETIHALLDRTHEVDYLQGEDTIGVFRAVVRR